MNPNHVGERTEAIVMSRLLQVYESVLLPFGNGRRYDFVVDTGRRFLRIQCKTGHLKSGAIVFNAFSQNPRDRKGRGIGYAGQVEYFSVYCPANDKVYLVPADSVGETKVYLRIEKTRNGQVKNIRMAESYELTPENVPE